MNAFKQSVNNSTNAKKTRSITSKIAERIVTQVQISLNYSFQCVFGLKAQPLSYFVIVLEQPKLFLNVLCEM